MCETTELLDKRPKEKARVLAIALRLDRALKKMDELVSGIQPEVEDEPDERRIRYVG